MPDITKRPFTPTSFTFASPTRISSAKTTDSQLRANALLLSHDQLQSVFTQLIQFRPTSKAAIAPLVASCSTETTDVDDSESKLFATKVKNCKYWLSDTWWSSHPSLPDGYACQVSRKAVRKEIGDIMNTAKPVEYRMGKGHEQCEIVLDAIVALIDIAQAVLRREGTPSGHCRSDRALGEQIGEQLFDIIFSTSSSPAGKIYAHEDCIWEHLLVPSSTPHPARHAISQLADMPSAPSNDDLFLYRTLRPTLARVAGDVKFYCEHGNRRDLMDDMPDLGDMDISSRGMGSSGNDSESEDEGTRRSKRR